jgi:hypothetical protein
MPKSLLTLDDHTQHMLDARRRSAVGRFQPVPPGTERVADVLATSCAAVAKAFAESGFRWSKSGLRFSRKIGPFTHIVSFRADGDNHSGSHVGLSMYAQVTSRDLARWREANGVTTEANVWISQVGYLSPTHEYIKWQLVDPSSRPVEIESMISTVIRLAMPAFETCSSMERLSTHLLDSREITSQGDWAIDIALWVGNKAAAEHLVAQYLREKPRLATAFHEHYRHHIEHSGHGRPIDRLERLAWACAKHHLAVPSAG